MPVPDASLDERILAEEVTPEASQGSVAVEAGADAAGLEPDLAGDPSSSSPGAEQSALNVVDEPVSDQPGLVTPAFAQASGDATTDATDLPVDEPVLHAAGCACAACRGGSAGSGAGSGNGLSSASLGTLDQLADYLETQFWTDFSGANSNRNFNLSDTGTYAKDGDLTYNTSGNSQDSDGLSSGREDLVDEAFKLFEATLGIDFQKTTASGADFRFGDDDSGAYASAQRSGSTTQ